MADQPPVDTPRYVVVTEQLTRYYGKKKAVDTLNLRIPEGCVYGFLGRNGAGKSTTIKLLMGMIRPDYGTVRIYGEEPYTMRPETRARIAYLAENHPLFPTASIKQMIEFARSFYPKWNDVLVSQILDHFELDPKKRIATLSNGQKAQVSLILGVAPDPELLILDDPTLGLDTVVRRDFLESMVQIVQKPGRTILFSSHILGDVERVADRIGVLVDGVLRVDCPTEQFKRSVRKVMLTFETTPPEPFSWDGLVSCRRFGEQLELVFARYGEEQQKLVASLQPQRIEEVELNLEDAFVEYTRGHRRSLPVFATGGES